MLEQNGVEKKKHKRKLSHDSIFSYIQPISASVLPLAGPFPLRWRWVEEKAANLMDQPIKQSFCFVSSSILFNVLSFLYNIDICGKGAEVEGSDKKNVLTNQ